MLLKRRGGSAVGGAAALTSVRTQGMEARGERQSTKGGAGALDLRNVTWRHNSGHFGTPAKLGLPKEAGRSKRPRAFADWFLSSVGHCGWGTYAQERLS